MVTRMQILFTIAIFVASLWWVLHHINKLPREIGMLREVWEDDRERFYSELWTLLFFWAITILLLIFIVIPTGKQVITGWQELFKLF